MFTKLAVTCGLFVAVTVGVLHPVATQESNEVTNLVAQEQETVSLPIKFVKDQEDENEPTAWHCIEKMYKSLQVDKSWQMRNSVHKSLHRDLKLALQFLMDQPKLNQEKRVVTNLLNAKLVVVRPGELTEESHGKLLLRIHDRDQMLLEHEAGGEHLQGAGDHDHNHADGGHGLTINYDFRAEEAANITPKLRIGSVQQDKVSILSKIPYIGRLFKNVGAIEAEQGVEP